MMQSKEKITRENAMDIIRRFAKEYRKTLGKAPAEIIIVGGGSIMLNYKFRDSTQDFDVILRAASGIKDVIHIWKDIGRQVDLYVNRISDIGSSDCLGGFETITSDCGGECVKIEHVAMYVNDLEKVRDFFVKYLNGKSNDLYHNKKTDFHSYFITFEDGARLEIMNKPDMVDAEKHLNRTGLIHIAFSVGSKERVDEITQLLQTDGYHIVSGPRTTGDGYYESCVVAIENNQIEFTV